MPCRLREYKQNQGGTIERSRVLNKGTVFTVRLHRY